MLDEFKVAVILPAAGKSKRFKAGQSADGTADADAVKPRAPGGNKIELDLAGKPAFLRSAELFLKRKDVGAVILAVDPDAIDEFNFRWGDKLAFHGVTVVPGGVKERWETVLNALKHVPDSCTHIAVHDAARPLASTKLIDRVFEAASRYDAIIPGVAVSSTLRHVAAEFEPEQGEADPLDAILGGAGKTQTPVRRAGETVDRKNTIAVQTPQVFAASLLRKAYEQITAGALDASGITDDAGLVEAMGEPVFVVEGEATNLKITQAADAEIAQALFAMRESVSKADLAKKRLFADDDED